MQNLGIAMRAEDEQLTSPPYHGSFWLHASAGFDNLRSPDRECRCPPCQSIPAGTGPMPQCAPQCAVLASSGLIAELFFVLDVFPADYRSTAGGNLGVEGSARQYVRPNGDATRVQHRSAGSRRRGEAVVELDVGQNRRLEGNNAQALLENPGFSVQPIRHAHVGSGVLDFAVC